MKRELLVETLRTMFDLNDDLGRILRTALSYSDNILRSEHVLTSLLREDSIKESLQAVGINNLDALQKKLNSSSNNEKANINIMWDGIISSELIEVFNLSMHNNFQINDARELLVAILEDGNNHAALAVVETSQPKRTAQDIAKKIRGMQ